MLVNIRKNCGNMLWDSSVRVRIVMLFDGKGSQNIGDQLVWYDQIRISQKRRLRQGMQCTESVWRTGVRREQGYCLLLFIKEIIIKRAERAADDQKRMIPDIGCIFVNGTWLAKIQKSNAVGFQSIGNVIVKQIAAASTRIDETIIRERRKLIVDVF